MDLKQGTMFFALASLENASRDRQIPQSIKDQLDRTLSLVKNDLEMCQQGLNRVKEDRVIGKLIYTLWRGRGSKHELDRLFLSLRGACATLKDLCLQLHMFRAAPSSYLLTRDTFKLVHETVGQDPSRRLPNSDVSIAKANYSVHNDRVFCDVIVEGKARENDLRFLSEKLAKDGKAEAAGVLPVLGYRLPPYNTSDGNSFFQLIFELSSNIRIESLANRICTSKPPSNLERLQICLNLSRLVSNIHECGLIHKAVRPRAIILLVNDKDSGEPEKMCIQDWSYVRDINGATTQLGELTWHRMMYQHPERQGAFADTAFTVKHGIYSLGVCFMEILLWKPFVLWDDLSSSIQICPSFETYALQPSNEDSGLPASYKGDPEKLTSRPLISRRVWCEMCSKELDDPAFRQLVGSCLNGEFEEMFDVVRRIESMIAVR